jgi:hypothetical protein
MQGVDFDEDVEEVVVPDRYCGWEVTLRALSAGRDAL